MKILFSIVDMFFSFIDQRINIISMKRLLSSFLLSSWKLLWSFSIDAWSQLMAIAYWHNQVRFKTKHFFCNVSIYFFFGSFWEIKGIWKWNPEKIRYCEVNNWKSGIFHSSFSWNGWKRGVNIFLKAAFLLNTFGNGTLKAWKLENWQLFHSKNFKIDSFFF